MTTSRHPALAGTPATSPLALTATRGRRTEGYCVRELIHAQVPGGEPTRAFEVARTTGERAGEVFRLLVAPGRVACDCPGNGSEATARADGRADPNGATLSRTCGCVYADAVTLLLAAGQLDVPQGPPEADEASAVWPE